MAAIPCLHRTGSRTTCRTRCAHRDTVSPTPTQEWTWSPRSWPRRAGSRSCSTRGTSCSPPLGVDTDPAAEPLAVPSNIDVYEAAGFAWPVDPQGVHLGSTLLKLRPRDMAAFGGLHLHEGRWNGDQIVSEAWVREATSAQVPAQGAAPSYGYLWWVGDEADDAAAYLAWGFGGQLIEVVPGRKLVVVISGAVDLLDPAGDSMDPFLMTQLVDDVIAAAAANDLR